MENDINIMLNVYHRVVIEICNRIFTGIISRVIVIRVSYGISSEE